MDDGIKPTSPEPEDHGRIQPAPKIHRIWAWIFPLIAAAAAGWMLWSNWSSRGPEIEIRFEEAPGIQAGKTVLIYRGVTSGHVNGVRLDPELGHVIVRVQLQAFATDLARQDSSFWIDKPVISVRETTGLEAIIQGNSIQARKGEGPPATQFVGLPQPPLTPLSDSSLGIRLYADNIPFLGRGTPIYHKGITVGYVRNKSLDENGRPGVEAIIENEFAHLVRTTSRFWILPATSLKLSARGASLDLPGLDALTEGGITFDQFGDEGEPAANQASFPLATSETAARMDGPEITLLLEDARGLLAGQSQLDCLGYPVGIVEKVELDPHAGVITAKARMDSRFAYLANTGSTLSLVRPEISLEGVSGLDTLLTGAYIAIDPGQGEPSSRFVVRPSSTADWEREQSEREGTTIVITAPELPPVEIDAPVFHRGLHAGRVLEKFSSSDGTPSLRVVIRKEFRDALTQSSRFWMVPAFAVQAGPGILEMQVESLETLIRSGLAFGNFSGDTTPPAQNGTTFPLYESETLARAVSPPIRIRLDNGQGLLAGKTQLRRAGVPVGIVEEALIKDSSVEVTARFFEGQDDLRKEGARFSIVQPRVSLQGLTGIETLLSGVYIECTPGSGAFASVFEATSSADPELVEKESTGFLVTLTSPRTGIGPGAPVLFRELVVGEIVEKSLNPDGTGIILTASIRPEHRDLVRTNSVFWDDSAVQLRIAFITVRISGQTILAPEGRVAFSNSTQTAEAAGSGHQFPLSKRPPRNR